MIKFERLSEKTYGTLSGYHYEIKMYNDVGEMVVDPQEATKFFVFEPRMLVTIDREEGRLTLTVSSDEEFSKTKKLQNRLKALANEFLINYTIRNYGKKIVPRDFAMDAKIKQHRELQQAEIEDGRSFQQKASEELSESISKMFGHRKTSYQKVNEVKIKVRHERSVNEEKRGARSRNIKSITLEWDDNAYQMPTNNLPAARAMASHVSRGGDVDDCVGEHISHSSKKLSEMKKFIKYAASNSLINEGTSSIIEALKEKISSIREDFSKIAKPSTYGEVSDRISQSTEFVVNETGENVDDLKDKFTVKYFDETFESLLPLIGKIVNEKEEYLKVVENQSMQSVGVSEIPMDHLVFENRNKKIAYAISMISESCEKELREYLMKVSNKLSNGTDLNDFEQRVVTNTLSNLTDNRESIVESITK